MDTKRFCLIALVSAMMVTVGANGAFHPLKMVASVARTAKNHPFVDAGVLSVAGAAALYQHYKHRWPFNPRKKSAKTEATAQSKSNKHYWNAVVRVLGKATKGANTAFNVCLKPVGTWVGNKALACTTDVWRYLRTPRPAKTQAVIGSPSMVVVAPKLPAILQVNGTGVAVQASYRATAQ